MLLFWSKVASIAVISVILAVLLSAVFVGPSEPSAVSLSPDSLMTVPEEVWFTPTPGGGVIGTAADLSGSTDGADLDGVIASICRSSSFSESGLGVLCASTVEQTA